MREQIETHTEARHQEFKENSESIVIEVAAFTSGDKERTLNHRHHHHHHPTEQQCLSVVQAFCVTLSSQTLIDNREVKWRII